MSVSEYLEATLFFIVCHKYTKSLESEIFFVVYADVDDKWSNNSFCWATSTLMVFCLSSVAGNWSEWFVLVITSTSGLPVRRLEPLLGRGHHRVPSTGYVS